jgi:hypothetical protein
MAKKWKVCEEVNSVLSPVIGEIFRSCLTGKVYQVKRICDQMVVLESLNGLNQVLTGRDHIRLFYEKVRIIEANLGRKKDR